jgi:hypothetical protein
MTSKEKEVIDFVNTMILEFQRDYGVDKTVSYGLTKSSFKMTLIANIIEIGHINKEAWYSWFQKIMSDKPYRNIQPSWMGWRDKPDPRYEC